MPIKIQKIEIEFPFLVELPPRCTEFLATAVNLICKKYEAENPDRVMWPAGHGSKPIWREPEEPEFDDSIYHISVAEREAHPKERERKQDAHNISQNNKTTKKS